MIMSIKNVICSALLILLSSSIKMSDQQELELDATEKGTTLPTSTNETADQGAANSQDYIEELSYDPYHALVLWHGNFILFACLVLAPGGIYIARFFKEVWSTKIFFGIPLWLMVHFAYMVATIMFMFLGLVFARAHNSALNATDEKEYENTDASSYKTFHVIAGRVVFGLFLLQFSTGHFLPFSNDSVRPIFRVIHWVFGTIATYFCIVIAMMSASLEGSQFPYFSGVVILAWGVFAIIMNVAGALTMHTQDKDALVKELEGKLVFYRAFWPFPIPLVNFDEEPRDTYLRTVLFVWFQFGCLAAFAIIMVPYSLGLGRYDCLEYSFINFDCATPRTHTIY